MGKPTTNGKDLVVYVLKLEDVHREKTRVQESLEFCWSSDSLLYGREQSDWWTIPLRMRTCPVQHLIEPDPTTFTIICLLKDGELMLHLFLSLPLFTIHILCLSRCHTLLSTLPTPAATPPTNSYPFLNSRWIACSTNANPPDLPSGLVILNDKREARKKKDGRKSFSNPTLFLSLILITLSPSFQYTFDLKDL